MRSLIRRKMDMAQRVRSFARANPSTDASYPPLLARLEELVARGVTLSDQQRVGLIDARAATRRRRELRQGRMKQLLLHLSRVGQLVARDKPDLAGHFAMVDPHVSNMTFLAAARRMLAEAQAAKDLFLAQGLAGPALEDLATCVAEWEETLELSADARRKHTGARSDLEAVIGTIADVVSVLDSLNRYRFRDNAELLGAWRSARNVVSPFQARGPETPPAGKENGPVTPPGGIAPAA